MSEPLLESIGRIEARARDAIAAAGGEGATGSEAAVGGETAFTVLQAIERDVIDKGGELNQILRGIKDLAPAERQAVGQAANEAKRRLEAAIAARRRELEQAAVAASL